MSPSLPSSLDFVFSIQFFQYQFVWEFGAALWKAEVSLSFFTPLSDKIRQWWLFLLFNVLRCGKAAKLKNYTHFGIQGYGECWSGPMAGKTFGRDGVQNTFTQRPAPKPWVGCVGDNFERCRGGNDQCVGQENTNFVYAFVNGKNSTPPTLPPISPLDLLTVFQYLLCYLELESSAIFNKVRLPVAKINS